MKSESHSFDNSRIKEILDATREFSDSNPSDVSAKLNEYLVSKISAFEGLTAMIALHFSTNADLYRKTVLPLIEIVEDHYYQTDRKLIPEFRKIYLSTTKAFRTDITEVLESRKNGG